MSDSEAPFAQELARLASAAGFVDPWLLRELRALLPSADARAEAAVWWSDDVEHRGTNGITFRPAALDRLRTELMSDRLLLDAVTVVERMHKGGPALLILEEQLIALALAGKADQIDRRLAAAVTALDDPTRAGEVLTWTERALLRLPREARETTSAWALALALHARVGVSLQLDRAGPGVRWDVLGGWLAKITNADVSLSLALHGEDVFAHDQPGFDVIRVPATDPRIVIVGDGRTARSIAIPVGGSANLGESSLIAKVANLRGETWTVKRSGGTRSANRGVLVANGPLMMRAYAGDRTILVALDSKPPTKGFEIEVETARPRHVRGYWLVERTTGGWQHVRARAAGQLGGGLNLQLQMTPPPRPIAVGFTRQPVSPSDPPPTESNFEDTGGTAYAMVLAYLDACLADKTSLVEALTSNIDHPVVLDRFARLGSRLSIVVDNVKQGKRVDDVIARLERSGCRVFRHRFRGLSHGMTLIRLIGKQPASVLTGSANYSVASLHGQRNFVTQIDEPQIAATYHTRFDDACAGRNKSYGAPFSKALSDGTRIEALFSSSRSIVDRIQSVIHDAQSSLLFSLPATIDRRVRSAIEAARRRRIFVAGLFYKTNEVEIIWGSGVAKHATLRQATSWSAPSAMGHGQFLVVDFHRPGATVVAGSPSLTHTSDKNGDGALLIYDPPVATTFAIEAIEVVTRLLGIDNAARGSWWKPYFNAKDPSCQLRELLIDRPKPQVRPRRSTPRKQSRRSEVVRSSRRK